MLTNVLARVFLDPPIDIFFVFFKTLTSTVMQDPKAILTGFTSVLKIPIPQIFCFCM